MGALPHHQGGGEDCTRCSTFNIPSFIDISDGKARRSCPRYALAGGRSHLRRGSWLRRLCPPLCVAPSRGLLRHACQVEHRCSSRLFGADGSLDRHHLRPDHLPGRRPSEPRTSAAHPRRFKDPESGKTLVFITNNFSLPADEICALYKSRLPGGTLLQVKIKQHLRIKQFYGRRRRGEDAKILVPGRNYVLVASVEASTWSQSTLCYRSSRHPLRENASRETKQMQRLI